MSTHPNADALGMKEVLDVLPVDSNKTSTRRPRHIVELDAQGQPTDKCLCGYLWDQVFVSHNGEICQECIDELKRRGLG